MTSKILEKCCKTGNIYNNKTWNYIAPLLDYDKSLIKVLKEYTGVAMGIKDKNCPDLFPKDTIGFLINARKSKIDFNHKLIINNYYYGELIYGHLHMVVLQLPDNFSGVLSKFINGEYSKMFKNPNKIYKTRKTIVFRDIEATCLEVCKQDKHLRKKVENYLGIPINGELDGKINLKKEYFNYE